MNKFLGSIFSSFILLSSMQAQEALQEGSCSECEMHLIDFVDVQQAQAEVLLNIMEGKTQNLALYFPQGTSIPLKAQVSGEYLELVNGDSDLCVLIKKDFYVRTDGEEFLLSSDLKTWQSFKQFFKGNLFAGLIKNEEDPVYALLEAKINGRN